MSNRYRARFDKLVPQRIAGLPIDVIGVGTIGRPLALQLAAMGAENVAVYDDDIVSDENVGNQGWAVEQIGRAKIDCVPARHRHKVRVDRATSLSGLVRFYCVDSAAARRGIVAAGFADLHVDGRIGGEQCQIISRMDAAALLATIPADEDEAALECGTQSTIYIGAVCSGIMLSQFARWLRGEEPHDCYHNVGSASGRWRFIA